MKQLVSTVKKVWRWVYPVCKILRTVHTVYIAWAFLPQIFDWVEMLMSSMM